MQEWSQTCHNICLYWKRVRSCILWSRIGQEFECHHKQDKKLAIKTLNHEESVNSAIVTDDLQIAGLDKSNFIDLPSVYIQDKIPVSTDDAPTQEDVNIWEHLKDINVKLPPLKGKSTIPRFTLMLGMNVPASTMPLEIRTGNDGELYAIRSKLGWLVYGLDKMKAKEKLPAFFWKSRNAQVIDCQYDLDQKFRALYNAEFSEKLSDPKELSMEDKRFL